MNDRRPPSLAFTAFERALLLSADKDEAPVGAAARALLALGVGASHAAVSQSASGASVTSPGAAWSLWQKPLLIGILGGVGFALSARLIDGPPPRPASVAALAPASTSALVQTPKEQAPNEPLPAHPGFVAPRTKAPVNEPARAGATPRAALDADTNDPGVTPVHPAPKLPDSVEWPPPATSPALGSASEVDAVTAGAGAATRVSPSIAAEVKVVDRARSALRAGRALDALAELAAYRERWPRGVLLPEVTVLEIEADLRLGARDSARRRARELVAAQPNTRYAARLRTLFDETELR